MVSARGSYPYPVLDDSDDVASHISFFNLSVAPTVDDIEIRFQVRMDDPTITQLIEAGLARFSFRWKCGATLSSDELQPRIDQRHADSTGFIAWIPQERVRRTVTIEVKVVATDDIPDYRLARQHSDYGDSAFDVQSGSVLADGGYATFEAGKLFDPLHPPIGSCFRFVADTQNRRGIRVRWNDDEYVNVLIPTELMPGLAGLASRPDLQISLVVLPALVETIQYIKENTATDGEDLGSRHWYAAIVGLVNQVGSFDDRPLDLAQKILGNPVDRSLQLQLTLEEDD